MLLGWAENRYFSYDTFLETMGEHRLHIGQLTELTPDSFLCYYSVISDLIRFRICSFFYLLKSSSLFWSEQYSIYNLKALVRFGDLGRWPDTSSFVVPTFEESEGQLCSSFFFRHFLKKCSVELRALTQNQLNSSFYTLCWKFNAKVYAWQNLVRKIIPIWSEAS